MTAGSIGLAGVGVLMSFHQVLTEQPLGARSPEVMNNTALCSHVL